MRELPAIPQAMQQHGGIAKNAATCGRDPVIDKKDVAKATPNPDNAPTLIDRAQKLRGLHSST